MNSTILGLATNSTFLSLTTGEWNSTEFTTWHAFLSWAFSSWSFWVALVVVTVATWYSFGREVDD